MASAAAAMFRLTGEQRYAELARKAVNWLKLPMEHGGALYRNEGFVFVAEYAYRSPPLPNIRVLDGEMMAAVSTFNTAAMLQDPEMARFAVQLAYSLVAQLDLFTAKDGRIMNARYQWLVDTDNYLLPMQRLAIELGMITKDQRMFDASAKWRRSDTYWPY